MAYVEKQDRAATLSGARDYVHIESGRVAWVDYLKGFCILLVVMLHSVIGVEKAAGADGWMHIFVEVSQPMRMPAFFLASGLFFMRSVDNPLRQFVDGKIVHFAYFYVLWLTIQFAFKAPGMAAEGGAAAPVENYLLAFVQPFGTLWFIYILPVFFIATRLLRPIPVSLVLGLAILLQILPIHTGAVLIDEFASYFVWFFAGYAFAPLVFALADYAKRNVVPAIAAMVAIIAVTALATATAVPVTLGPAGHGKVAISMLPFVSLVLGIGGVIVLVSASALLSSHRWAGFIGWCGSHSIVIYLAFFLPMAVTRVVLLKLGIIPDVGTISLLVWIAAIAGPLILFWLVETTGFGRFLFERPQWARVGND
ncbi:acyltransferase family protein [Hoeflea prorocentri]|uniref:Acyltransferase family protein n=1 Tax=Hoeflea prorocentri TaxID=1922333 RepID=A0A9X3UKR7_9HYPH|nr:acyltransferase family protein [Hoeflea prorocentri]MCY6383102.1 acyltransferase family protein [Hoeflea prorocentri]MDA5400902.1 acyltransferase family protein [Hoeflea prorocentri]